MSELRHSHFCKYCESTWYCADLLCHETGNGIDKQSKLQSVRSVKYHACREREKRMEMLKAIQRGPKSCQYGCKSLPCMHDKFAPLDYGKSNGYEFDWVRPPIVTLNSGTEQAKQFVLCDENSYTSQQYQLQKQLERLERENAKLKDKLTK